MKATLISTLVLALIVVGCSKNEPQAQQNTTPPVSGDASKAHDHASMMDTDGEKAHKLGEKAAKDHFAVVLQSEPKEPKMGKVKFAAEVDHHGEPFPGGLVRLELSMPDHKMDVPGVSLKAEKGNKYEGTVDLPMGGMYDAKVLVLGTDGHADVFLYRIDVSQ